jgi:predicted Zn-dependent protease
VNKWLSAVGAGILLAGCAASPHDGRGQLTAPKAVSAVYTEVGMHVKLAATPDLAPQQADAGCGTSDSLERRVGRIGAELTKAAFDLYPDLGGRVEKFEFAVADKAEPGTVSTALGRIVVLRPVDGLAPTDLALAFMLAREIGHVVANHHDENTAASLLASGLAYLLMPVAGVAKLLSDLLLSGAATVGGAANAAANASVTATSYLGSRMLSRVYKPKQQEEADAIALNLLARLGYDATAVAASFALVDLRAPDSEWIADLRASVERLSREPGRGMVLEAHGGAGRGDSLDPRFGLLHVALNQPDLSGLCGARDWSLP